MNSGASLNRTIAFCRVLTGVMLLAEGYAKLAGRFVHGGFAKEAAEMASNGYPFWRPVLGRLVIPHPVLFAWAVALGESLLGLSLLLGLLVRAASIAGIVMLLSIGFGGAFPPAGAPGAAYVTGWLAPAGYIFLLAIFASSDAGKTWGIDARRK